MVLSSEWVGAHDCPVNVWCHLSKECLVATSSKVVKDFKDSALIWVCCMRVLRGAFKLSRRSGSGPSEDNGREGGKSCEDNN